MGGENRIKDMVGQRFGRLVVVSLDESSRGYGLKWNCICDCGTYKPVSGAALRKGLVQSCGCMRVERLSTRCLKDLTGQRFGHLTVLYREQKKPNGGGVKWVCSCDCGSQTVVSSSNLASGHTRSCGCAARHRIEDFSGKSLGDLVVIGEAVKRSGAWYWPCRCSCGTELQVAHRRLKGGGATHCGCKYKWRKQSYGPPFDGNTPAFRTHLSTFYSRARKYGRPVEFSPKEIYDIEQQPCYYCGAKSLQVSRSHGGTEYVYNGLDRIDSALGYVPGNVVPCCGICNRAKGAMTQSEFMEWAHGLCEHLLVMDRK